MSAIVIPFPKPKHSSSRADVMMEIRQLLSEAVPTPPLQEVLDRLARVEEALSRLAM